MPCAEDVGESRLLGEIDIDMDRIVIAGRATIERQRMTADGRKCLVNEAFADRWMFLCRLVHDTL